MYFISILMNEIFFIGKFEIILDNIHWLKKKVWKYLHDWGKFQNSDKQIFAVWNVWIILKKFYIKKK